MGILIASKTVHVNYRIYYESFQGHQLCRISTRSRCCIETASTAGLGFTVHNIQAYLDNFVMFAFICFCI